MPASSSSWCTVTLVTSFTASTNVPVSHAGTSAQARLIMQLAPAGCSSLSLTVLVQGSGTFSNSQSHALVLGTAGSNTITDTGTGNCIVGGGGTDSTTGTATDICITGPTLNIANPCPVAAPTLTFAISGTQPTTATAGTAFNVTVHALSNGALDTTYTRRPRAHVGRRQRQPIRSGRDSPKSHLGQWQRDHPDHPGCR